MKLINNFLILINKIELTNLIIFSCFCIYLVSFKMILSETENMTNQFMVSNNMPERKSKFLKEKIRINANIISEEKGKMWGFATSFIAIKARNTLRRVRKKRKP